MEDLQTAKVQPDPHSAEPLVAIYRGVSLVSRLVRWQTWSDYSHAALWLPDGSVIEAWHRGGVQRHASLGAVHTPGTVVDLFRVVAPVEWDAALLSATEHLGKRYAWSNILRFILRWTSSDCRHPQALICSQLVHLIVEDGGVRLLQRICASRVSPRDLSISPLLRFVRSEVTTAGSPATTHTHPRAEKAGASSSASTAPALAAAAAPSGAAARKARGMMQGTPLDSWSGFITEGVIFSMAAALGLALLVGVPRLVPAVPPAPGIVVTRELVPHFRITAPDLR